MKSKTKEQLVASELLPEQSALDKALEELCRKTILIKNRKILEKEYVGETLKEQ